MVVHAGHDTKLYKNMKYKKHNISFVEKCSEMYFFFIVLIVIVLSIVNLNFPFKHNNNK